MTRRPRLIPATALLVALATLNACGSDREPPPASDSSSATSAAPPTTPLTTHPAPTASPQPRKPVRVRGIDASHHQGAIDWPRVADDGIAFAYLKATEGTTYVDPTFAGHRAAAQRAGLRVGGYHYFQLCSDGAGQAAHFTAVLGTLDRDDLPPAVDLELAGSCGTPPARDVLLAEVRTFLDRVETSTGRTPIVYLFPELEAAYGFAAELGDHRQWVRSLDGPPGRDWWIWQQTDSGSVAGIAGPVDVNVMRRVLPE